jgi:hypothetical protein
MERRRDKHFIIMNCSDSRLIDYAEEKKEEKKHISQ